MSPWVVEMGNPRRVARRTVPPAPAATARAKAGENQALAGEVFQQGAGEEDRGDAAESRGYGGPGDGRAVTAGLAAVEASDALEVVIRSIAVGKPQRRDNNENHDSHPRILSFRYSPDGSDSGACPYMLPPEADA